MARPFIFISYSREDEAEKESLLTHLKGLQLCAIPGNEGKTNSLYM